MKGKFLLFSSIMVLAAALAVWSAPAQATMFNFNDEYYFNATAQTAFNNVYGVANSAPVSRSGLLSRN